MVGVVVVVVVAAAAKKTTTESLLFLLQLFWFQSWRGWVEQSQNTYCNQCPPLPLLLSLLPDP